MPRYEKYELGISEKRIQDFVEALRNGVPLKYACDLAFIFPQQYSRWKRIYDDFISKVDSGEETDLSLLEIPVDKNDTLIYSKLNILTLCLLSTHARADCLNTYLQNLKDDPEHYQRWSWLLERTFRKEFGKDVVEESTNKSVDKIQIVYVDSNKDDNELKKLEQEAKEELGIDGNTN